MDNVFHLYSDTRGAAESSCSRTKAAVTCGQCARVTSLRSSAIASAVDTRAQKVTHKVYDCTELHDNAPSRAPHQVVGHVQTFDTGAANLAQAIPDVLATIIILYRQSVPLSLLSQLTVRAAKM